MPKLAHLVDMMNKKATGIDGGEVLEMLMESIVSRKTDAANSHQAVVAAIDKAVRTIVAAIKAIPQTDLRPVLDSVVENRADFGPLIRALDAIEIPQIPEQKETDLSGVMAELARLARKIDEIDVSLPEITVQAAKQIERIEEEKEPKQWVFEVKRNQSGFMREVIARQV